MRAPISDDPHQLIYLTTRGWKTGKQHTIEIWFVEYRQRYYVMSERLGTFLAGMS